VIPDPAGTPDHATDHRAYRAGDRARRALRCDVEPVTIVGLGENLLPTDAGVFVGGEGPSGAGGFGVSASEVTPLSSLTEISTAATRSPSARSVTPMWLAASPWRPSCCPVGAAGPVYRPSTFERYEES